MSLFTSQHWLDASKDCWPQALGWQVIALETEDARTGSCILGRGLLKRHSGMLSSRTLSLNQSLDTAWDQVFIEYNGFYLAEPGSFSNLLSALLHRLNDDAHWDELRLAGLRQVDARLACQLAKAQGLKVRVLDQRPSFARSLNDARAQGTILGGLSGNTRAQLRRSRRLIESIHGPVRLLRAKSTSQAVAWFDEIGPWHRLRWTTNSGLKSSSGFDNPAFVRFHHTLIRSAFPAHQVRLWRLLAGDRTLALLYNFRWDATEAFYLGAWDPELDPAMRAGLVAHQMVMDECLREGLDRYDFMAGDSQYKRQLANQESELIWLTLQRPCLKFWIEDRARSLRDQLRDWCNRQAAHSGLDQPTRDKAVVERP